MKRRWRKKLASEPTEVNITAFMNLMVILVPFLLITAVFSRITILELNLPTEGAPSKAAIMDDKEQLKLEVIVRKDVVEIQDRHQVGTLKVFSVMPDGSHLKQISDLLQQIKARFPDKQDITLLLEMDTSYDQLVEMMDTLRVARVERDGEVVMAELFPTISIGDAPPGGASVGKLRTAKRNKS
ncbi:MAG TPA: biopolymer transporter ExbD [Gammaproteobacteria bacterium]|nr:biopolymer transporter ExbD [Gammaproteobacteria bacterium]